MSSFLHQGWTVEPTAGPVTVAGRRLLPATVPGCVTLDLMRAGIVPDPYIGTNEELHQWIGRTNWLYQTSFEAEPGAGGERVDLVFEGLDTVATVRLNGYVLGTTANMHRTYRFDVRHALVTGTNTLSVEFKAPLDAAEQMSEELGPRPYAGLHPFNAIRKMACNYGWDWGPDLPTAGIWRPVRLQRWRTARITGVRPLVRVTRFADSVAGGPVGESWADGTSPRTGDGVVEVHVDMERDGDDAVRVTASVGAGREPLAAATADVAPGVTSVVLEMAVPDVQLWWPAGYGAQPLYDLDVQLSATGRGPGAEGQLDDWSGRVGFRSIKLDTRADERGAGLGFVVNGRAVQVRGANWIPDDCFPSRVGADRYRHRLDQARGANINLLRVWGGGLYESEDFYDATDELGILVWQDFLLACAAYAEESPLGPELEAEAREAVTRLSRHASLAAWSGGNENIWGHEDWGWGPKLNGKTWGAGYYFEVFPRILGELDPDRPYMAGSPWSLGYDVHPNDPRYGSMHVWDVWNEKDYISYREHKPRFVAEFGFQGPPTWSTLTRAIGERSLSKDSPELAAHEKAVDGLKKLERSLTAHFPEPASFDDWFWATSLNQARAIAFAIEHWRSLDPRCRGTVLWQLNDCWPVISWAVVDGDAKLKPAWYALRRSYADRLLTVQPAAGDRDGGTGLVVAAINDGGAPWELVLEVSRQDFYGDVRAKATMMVKAQPGQSVAANIEPEVATPEDPHKEVLVVEGGGERALWFYADEKDLALPEPELDARVEKVGDGYEVVLRAFSLQRDVAVLAERLSPDAESDDMLFTLLPGESKRVHIRSAGAMDPEALVGPTVLRSANQLGKVR